MSARKVVELACNHKRCNARFCIGMPTAELTRMAAAQQQEGERWTHERRPRLRGGPAYSIDLCPAHAGSPDHEIWFGEP